MSTTLTRDEQRKLIRSFNHADEVGEYSDAYLVVNVVGEVLNGMEIGSREEALLNELVDRFSAHAAIE